jgi:hypothetical protein
MTICLYVKVLELGYIEMEWKYVNSFNYLGGGRGPRHHIIKK